MTGGAQLDDDRRRGHRKPLVEQQIKHAIYERLILANRRYEAEAARLAGRYVRASEIDGMKKAAIMRTLDLIEASIDELATALSDQFRIPLHEAVLLVAVQMKTIRKRATTERRPGNGKGH